MTEHSDGGYDQDENGGDPDASSDFDFHINFCAFISKPEIEYALYQIPNYRESEQDFQDLYQEELGSRTMRFQAKIQQQEPD